MLSGWLSPVGSHEVLCSGHFSSYITSTVAAPLSPNHHLVYINDLPEVVSSSTKIFVDDTKLNRSIRTAVQHPPDDVAQLQIDINAITK